jgi:hypothetical protein
VEATQKSGCVVTSGVSARHLNPKVQYSCTCSFAAVQVRSDGRGLLNRGRVAITGGLPRSHPETTVISHMSDQTYKIYVGCPEIGTQDVSCPQLGKSGTGGRCRSVGMMIDEILNPSPPFTPPTAASPRQRHPHPSRKIRTGHLAARPARPDSVRRR